MIAFVCAWSPPESPFYREQFERCARAGILRQPSSMTFEMDASDGLAGAYERSKALIRPSPYIDATVFLHADMEILDPEFTAKVLDAFSDPEVAIVGLIGARNIKSIEWWKGDGVGQVHQGSDCAWPGVYFKERTGDVDVVDGCLVALSPWAMANLDFDPKRFPKFHGWDIDICTNARVHGKKVRVIDSEARHHTKGTFGDRDAFEAAYLAYERKWGPWLLRKRK